MSRINYRLYASLLIMGLCPAIYQTVRIFLLGRMPDPGAYSIAGQLSWVQLLYEIIQEAVLLPLYFFLGQVVADKVAFSNRVRSGLWLTAGIWTALSFLLSVFAKPLLGWMAAAPNIIDASATYIRIESVANIFVTLSSFALVALVTLGRERWLYVLTGSRLVLSLVFDSLLISNLPFSLHLGVNGIGWSNLATNGILLVVALVLLDKEGVTVGIGEVQSLITNAVYYGGAFLLYRAGIWAPTLTGIAMLFGWGMVFGGAVTAVLYWKLLQSRKRLAA